MLNRDVLNPIIFYFSETLYLHLVRSTQAMTSICDEVDTGVELVWSLQRLIGGH